jgi:hypothetical protein
LLAISFFMSTDRGTDRDTELSNLLKIWDVSLDLKYSRSLDSILRGVWRKIAYLEEEYKTPFYGISLAFHSLAKPSVAMVLMIASLIFGGALGITQAHAQGERDYLNSVNPLRAVR